MFKRYIPYAHANSIFDIAPSFFTLHGIKTIFVDLDNTLDSYKSSSPSSRVFELHDSLLDNGIEMIIISNNKEKRVENYATQLGVKYLASAHKPFKRRILKFMNENNIRAENTVLVGDQLLTDVKLGYNAKIRVILTEKIVKEDQWTTHFNRMIDRPIRKYLRNHDLLVKWVNVHE